MLAITLFVLVVLALCAIEDEKQHRAVARFNRHADQAIDLTGGER